MLKPLSMLKVAFLQTLLQEPKETRKSKKGRETFLNDQIWQNSKD